MRRSLRWFGVVLVGIVILFFFCVRGKLPPSEVGTVKISEKSSLKPAVLERETGRSVREDDSAGKQAPVAVFAAKAALKVWTPEELTNLNLIVFQKDGTVTEEFFSQFEFTSEQRAGFLVVWKKFLGAWKNIESAHIADEVRENGTVSFTIKEDPVTGQSFRKNMMAEIEPTSPAAAFLYLSEFAEKDHRYTFGDFGLNRRRITVRFENNEWKVEDQQLRQTNVGEWMSLGSISTTFKTLPPRFDKLFQ